MADNAGNRLTAPISKDKWWVGSMKSEEILKLYAQGERNFRGLNLRGQSFRDKDLQGADFSKADIRGTDFTGAL